MRRTPRHQVCWHEVLSRVSWSSITQLTSIPSHIFIMAQSKRWCFTINNYTDEDITRINGIECDYLVFGRERGESGTPHLQGFVIFSSNQRFNAVKNAIGSHAHIEVARGTSAQASNYCKKDNDFEERGNLPVNQGRRSDWERYRSWVVDLGRLPTRRELATEFTSLYARYDRKCFEIAELCLPTPSLVSGNLRPGYQERLYNSFFGDPDERVIEFIVDVDGNKGKSWFCAYCLSELPERVQVLRVGRREDLAYAIDPLKDIFLFDVGRKQMQFFQYSILEMLKDRMVFSQKYESRMKVLLKRPHVVVFSNEEPDREALTDDRFNIELI